MPSERGTAQRLYPVKLRDVVQAMAEAVAHPQRGVRIIEANELRGVARHGDLYRENTTSGVA